MPPKAATEPVAAAQAVQANDHLGSDAPQVDDPLSPAAAPAAAAASSEPVVSAQADAVQANDLLTDASLPAASLTDASLSPDASLGKDAPQVVDASLGKDASLPAASLSPAASLTAASLQTNAPPPAQVDATQQAAQQEPVQAVQAAAAAPEQVESAPPVVAATKAVPVDANYSAILGAFVHELAELYGIKDDAKVVITSDMVSAANFKSTLEANNETLTITMKAVNSTGTAALEAIKLKIEAPKPAVVSAVEAAVEPVKPVESEAAAVQATTSPLNSDASADKENQTLPVITLPKGEDLANLQVAAPAVKIDPVGGYRRRKRNLRTIKKQQRRNRRTMNKH